MIAQNVAAILGDHVRLTVEAIDRMYLNVYVPRLQSTFAAVNFFREHRGQPLASAALMAPMSRGFVAELEGFAARHRLPVVAFAKGQRKDDVMAEHLRRLTAEEGVVFIGKAQERASVFRTQKRRRPGTGQAYPWIVKSTAMVNHYYIYALDRDFGPFFLKFCSYFPYNAKLCLNGHEYAKRQLGRQAIAYQALDNGVLSCADAGALQRICDQLSAEKIDGLLRKVTPPAASLHHRRSTGGLSLRHLDPASRVLTDPGPRSPGVRPHLLRAGDPREQKRTPKIGPGAKVESAPG